MRREKLYGIAASAISMLLLFLLLWFVQIGRPHTEEEEGVMVSFGDTDLGGGEYTETPASQAAVPAAPPAAAQNPSDNEYMTQEDEEALALARQRKQEEERKQKAAEEERLRKQREEAARIEAERRAKEQAAAEQRAKEQAAINKANQLGSLFGQSSNADGGGGADNASGQKGNPAGQGQSGGHSWSLRGRDLRSQLASPSYNGAQEGTVVVEIRVNAAGKVVSATIANGTTISDRETQRAAMAAAQQTVFSEGTSDVIGTITYKFKLK